MDKNDIELIWESYADSDIDRSSAFLKKELEDLEQSLRSIWNSPLNGGRHSSDEDRPLMTSEESEWLANWTRKVRSQLSD